MQTKKRDLKFSDAIREATDLCMAKDPAVYVLGLGAPDPKGIFGTTLGLQKKYGEERVMDMPTSENGMTGVAIGSALAGMRPVMTHQRLDFALLSLEQIVNQAAKWHYMFGGKMKVPLVIRMIMGRGWGQGPQHSQSLHAWFAHVPGLKVVMPAFPYDAKGLLISSIEDNNPVIFLEHRWLHNILGRVPEGIYRVPIGAPQLIREGSDITFVAASYMSLEALKAAELLAKDGISAEVIDLRTLAPLDDTMILESIHKTGRLIAADIGWKTGGFGAGIISRVVEKRFQNLKCAPTLVASPDIPTPTSHALAKYYYPTAFNLVNAAKKMMGVSLSKQAASPDSLILDVPDPSFKGPF